MTTDLLLSRVDVRNFKSIREASLDLRQLTVIVGENSAGKSSLLQAIFLLAQIVRGRGDPDLVSLNGLELELGEFADLVHAGSTSETIELALTVPSGAPIARRGFGSPGLWRPTARRRSAQFDDDEATWRLTLAAPEDELGVARIAEIHVAHLRAGIDLVVTPNEDQAEAIEMYEHSRRLGLLRPMPAARAQLVSEADAVTAFRARLIASAPDVLEPEESFPVAMVENGLPTALFALKSESESLAETWVDAVRRRTDMEMARSGRRARGSQATLPLDMAVPRTFDAVERLFPEFRKWVDELDRMLDPQMPRASIAPLPDDLYVAVAEAERTVTAELTRLLDVDRPERAAIAPQPSATLEISAAIRSLLYNAVHYLGPLREDPSPSYRPGQRGGIATLGRKGEYTIAILNSHRSQPTECPLIDGGVETMRLEDAVDYWAELFGLAGKVRTLNKGRSGIEAELTDLQTGARRDLTSVGVGVSQLLPVIVLCLIAQPGELVMIEQPELHLHPAPQQVLGDFLLRTAQSGRQLIVETHSEYLANRLRLHIARDEDDTVTQTVQLWYARRDKGRTAFELLKPNRFGSFDDWPDGFFDQAPREAEEILRAAAKKRRGQPQERPDSSDVAEHRVPIHVDYQGQRVEATFDPDSEAVVVLSDPLRGRSFASPSGAAVEIVRRLNPDVSPNRNGWNFWIVTATGAPLSSIRQPATER